MRVLFKLWTLVAGQGRSQHGRFDAVAGGSKLWVVRAEAQPHGTDAWAFRERERRSLQRWQGENHKR